MVGSGGVRTAANLGSAALVAVFLGACSSMSLPSFSSSPSAAPEPAPAPEMPATIRPDEIVSWLTADDALLEAAWNRRLYQWAIRLGRQA